jgi:tetratricopeptide (TPR) repeat protein
VTSTRIPPDTAQTSTLQRRIFLLLAGVALIYALLAGLRTVSDPDLGWQLATGRWVAQHHRVVSYDVFSYTANGQPWIYPAGSGLLFYWIYLLGGYVLLSWFGAIACVATVALLLRRGSACSAAIAVLAIPLIAERTTPRAEMFTVILFAAFLSILWQNYQTGRARLWLLPLLMVAWVNLHLGFVAGLALVAAFVVADLLKLLSPQPARSDALRHLRRLWPWLLATAAATLVNPWGWKLYQAILRQNRVMAQHTQLIDEWAKRGWSSLGAIPGFAQQPVQHTLAMLLWIALLAAVIALLQRRLFAAFLLLVAAYASLRHLRMEALTACIVAVVGGAVLSSAIPRFRVWLPNPRWRSVLATAAAVAVVMFVAVRCASFVDDHFYLRSNHLSGFGTGLGWWEPQAAAEFVAREHLPGNLFNTYNTGGYLVWTLGPQYPDYIDGRAIPFGLQALPHEQQLLATSLDSPEWQQEADHYNINFMILPVEGYEIPMQQLPDLCSASNWRPVYLDELAIVLLRRTPQTQPLVDRLQISCATASLTGMPLDHTAASFPRWVNAAYVLLALHRDSEALAAADTAAQIFADSARLHAIRGNILYASHRPTAAEQEWLTSISLQPDAAVYSALAEFYEQQQRIPEAVHAWQQAVQQTTNPALKARSLVRLAHLYVETGHARDALPALDEAVSIAPPEMQQAAGGRSFRFNVAQARAAAWFSLHDLPRAILFQEEAVQLDPDAGDAWAHLAKLYGRQGRAEDERRAEQRATALATSSESP